MRSHRTWYAAIALVGTLGVSIAAAAEFTAQSTRNRGNAASVSSVRRSTRGASSLSSSRTTRPSSSSSSSWMSSSSSSSVAMPALSASDEVLFSTLCNLVTNGSTTDASCIERPDFRGRMNSWWSDVQLKVDKAARDQSAAQNPSSWNRQLNERGELIWIWGSTGSTLTSPNWFNMMSSSSSSPRYASSERSRTNSTVIQANCEGREGRGKARCIREQMAELGRMSMSSEASSSSIPRYQTNSSTSSTSSF